MFREDRSPIVDTNFGAGSTFRTNDNCPGWLVVVAASNTQHVRLVKLDTFEASASVSVANANHLSWDEVSSLVELTGLQFARSDFEFFPRGFKQVPSNIRDTYGYKPSPPSSRAHLEKDFPKG